MKAGNGIRYVFVHGLSGWGSYDERNRRFPYWGTRSGDLTEYLTGLGFPCHAASVSPEGSAWDRACELYAQLAGTVVDYGKAHSRRCVHERFGRDFSKKPLIPDWESGTKIVLLGHSFGGATIRLFSEILANGSEEEREVTEDEELSRFFKGGQGERVHALVTLAAPTNGTTAYDLYRDPSFDISSVRISRADRFWGNIFSRRKTAPSDGRIPEDRAMFDMHIDNALVLNERISTLPNVYYFAVPCSATRKSSSKGVQVPVRKLMEPMFRRTSYLMGSYSGTTAGGFTIGLSWQENDGLVNTVSAKAPLNALSVPFERGSVKPGIWQVMPVFCGDHMALQGGLLKKTEIRPFYRELLEMICGLPFAG